MRVGTTAVLGAAVVASGWLALSPSPPQPTSSQRSVQEHRVAPSDGDQFDSFGYDLAVDGNWLIAGANQSGNAAGAAYVYEWSAAGWVNEQKLIPSDRTRQDHFGMAVDISGSHALIGAYRHDPNDGLGRRIFGAAYFYALSGGTWVEEAMVQASTPETGAEFGEAVALDGDFAVVGSAFADDSGVTDKGRAFVFQNKGGWVETQILTAPDGHETSYFGQSVEIAGDYIFVGSGDHRPHGGPRLGSVWVFRRDTADVWQFETRLTPGDLQDGDAFGVEIDADGDRVAIGAENGYRGDISTGAAYVYRRTAQGWQLEGRVTAHDAVGAEFFGAALAIREDTLVVGAWQSMQAGAYAQGAAYRFEFQNGTWREVGKTLAGGGSENDYFGKGVDLDQGRTVIGASGASGVGSPGLPQVGAVYTYY